MDDRGRRTRHLAQVVGEIGGDAQHRLWRASIDIYCGRVAGGDQRHAWGLAVAHNDWAVAGQRGGRRQQAQTQSKGDDSFHGLMSPARRLTMVPTRLRTSMVSLPKTPCPPCGRWATDACVSPKT